jgi:cell division protein FtsZ
MPLLDTFKRADEVLLNAVQGISDLIQYHGYINVDFADVKTIMGEQGLALMGTGRASGEKRALRAMEQAVSSPLLEDVSIDGARGLLINITAGRDITLQEINEAICIAQDAADPEANIIFGSLVDENANDEVKITVIATGFVSRETAPRRASVTEQPRVVPQQQPLLRSAQNPTVTAAPAMPMHATTQVHQREEMASLVPGKSTLAPPPQRTLSGEHRVSPPTRLTSAREVTLDEDQYDIPTFLRRQGQTEMP